MSIEARQFKYSYVFIDHKENTYNLSWMRGKLSLDYFITKELFDKLSQSEKDELEVMFYAEKGRWPKDGELDHYNETDVITHRGNGFVIYEDNGEYEMRWQTGSLDSREAVYPITKDLMVKALKSDEDASAVMTYLETGHWPEHDQDEIDRQFIRRFPEILLRNPDANRDLFSEKEFEELVKKARSEANNNLPDEKTTVKNSDYGGFVVSKNILSGAPTAFAYREAASVPALNGWTLFSDRDDEAYTQDPQNFEVVSAETLFPIVPVMREIFDAPYDTHLFWQYEEGVHVGFQDLDTKQDVSIAEIVEGD